MRCGLGSCNPKISIRQMNFQYMNPNYEKLKSFVETFTPYNPILWWVFFEEQLCMSFVQFGFLYLMLTRPKLTDRKFYVRTCSVCTSSIWRSILSYNPPPPPIPYLDALSREINTIDFSMWPGADAWRPKYCLFKYYSNSSVQRHC
jgi:hypothetical protein